MQARPHRNALAGDLGAGRLPECSFETAEMTKAILRRGLRTDKGAECAAMHGANRAVSPDRKDHGRDVVTPSDFVVQADIARPRPNGSIMRTISQAATRPASHTALVSPIRVTMANVKAPSPPKNGVAASSVNS